MHVPQSVQLLEKSTNRIRAPTMYIHGSAAIYSYMYVVILCKGRYPFLQLKHTNNINKL